jgi:hypothetical protein
VGSQFLAESKSGVQDSCTKKNNLNVDGKGKFFGGD